MCNADGHITSCTCYTLGDDNESWEELNRLEYTYAAGSSTPTQCVYTGEDAP